jgi:hypothetical protein
MSKLLLVTPSRHCTFPSSERSRSLFLLSEWAANAGCRSTPSVCAPRSASILQKRPSTHPRSSTPNTGDWTEDLQHPVSRSPSRALSRRRPSDHSAAKSARSELRSAVSGIHCTVVSAAWERRDSATM